MERLSNMGFNTLHELTRSGGGRSISTTQEIIETTWGHLSGVWGILNALATAAESGVVLEWRELAFVRDALGEIMDALNNLDKKLDDASGDDASHGGE